MIQILKDAAFTLTALPWPDFFDVLLSTVIIYYVVMAIKGTRAVQLAWGLVLLFLFAQAAERAQFRTLSLLLGTVATPGATVAIVILFYPELRHALEEVGRGRFWAIRGLMLRREDIGVVVDDLVDTAVQLSQHRTGALIVLARDDGLDDVTSTGTLIGATVSPRLLMTIFYPGTPLHDGAVIIRGREVIAAECVLPLSDNSRISSSLHTRHRAALGLAERTDAAVLVVSEETGNISLAYDGRLLTALPPEVVRDKLFGLLQQSETQDRRSGRPAGKGGSGTPGGGEKERPALPSPPEDTEARRPLGVAAAVVLDAVSDVGHWVSGRRGRVAKGESSD